jgi:hypothetical protein
VLLHFGLSGEEVSQFFGKLLDLDLVVGGEEERVGLLEVSRGGGCAGAEKVEPVGCGTLGFGALDFRELRTGIVFGESHEEGEAVHGFGVAAIGLGPCEEGLRVLESAGPDVGEHEALIAEDVLRVEADGVFPGVDGVGVLAEFEVEPNGLCPGHAVVGEGGGPEAVGLKGPGQVADAGAVVLGFDDEPLVGADVLAKLEGAFEVLGGGVGLAEASILLREGDEGHGEVGIDLGGAAVERKDLAGVGSAVIEMRGL